MKCPRCQQDNSTEQKFYGECGTPLAGAARARPYADLKDENEGLRRSLTEALEQHRVAGKARAFSRCFVALGVVLCTALSAGAQPPAVRTPESERERWNQIFTRQPASIRTDANRLLVQVASELVPGVALDIGMGFGRNAIFLARRGWRVTGFDISDVGVEKARLAAQAENLPLTASREDMFKFDYGLNRYDLIAFLYMPAADRLARQIADALKPGGVLVIEHFLRRPDGSLGYESRALPKLFPTLEVLRYTEDDSNPDYDQENVGRVVRFVARKAR